MKNTPLLQIAIIIVVFSCACTRPLQEEVLLPELSEVESIMYEHPDSALHPLQQMSVPPATAKLQQATWALFMTQAKYKNYIEQDDSLIDIAFDYFIKKGKGNAQRKALTYYYKAVVCHEHQRLDEAQDYYLKAATEVAQTDDYLLGHLIYAGLGTIYAYGNYPDYALKTYMQANDYAQKEGHKRQMISGLSYLARAYAMQEKYDSCIEYYGKAILLAKEYPEAVLWGSIIEELGGVYCNMGNYKKGMWHLKEGIRICNEAGAEPDAQDYFMLGELYRNLGQNDSSYISRKL